MPSIGVFFMISKRLLHRKIQVLGILLSANTKWRHMYSYVFGSNLVGPADMTLNKVTLTLIVQP